MACRIAPKVVIFFIINDSLFGGMGEGSEAVARLMEMLRMRNTHKRAYQSSTKAEIKCKPSCSSVQYVKKMKSVDFCVQGIAAGLPLRLRPELMLPNNFHCPLSTGGRQITMPMHRYKTQIESPEAKCPRFALIRYRMRSRALRKLQMHTIAPKGYRKAREGSYLSADVLCHPKSSLKARARANGNGVEVGDKYFF